MHASAKSVRAHPVTIFSADAYGLGGGWCRKLGLRTSTRDDQWTAPPMSLRTRLLILVIAAMLVPASLVGLAFRAEPDQ